MTRPPGLLRAAHRARGFQRGEQGQGGKVLWYLGPRSCLLITVRLGQCLALSEPRYSHLASAMRSVLENGKGQLCVGRT